MHTNKINSSSCGRWFGWVAGKAVTCVVLCLFFYSPSSAALAQDVTSPFLKTCQSDLKNAQGATTWQSNLEKLRGQNFPLIEGDLATFVYLDAAPKEVRPNVELVGDITGWGNKSIPFTRLEQTPLYFVTLPFPQDARVEYQIKVDGKWMLDPGNSRKLDNGVGGENSFFSMPGYAPFALPVFVTDIPHGEVVSKPFASQILHDTRATHVYTPPAYKDNESLRYPVLYVHDGTQYLQRTQFCQIVDTFIHLGKISSIMMVFVDPVKRNEEYSGSPDYCKFVLEELIPYVEQNYRTIPQAHARAVMGASMGGLIATYLGFQYPDVFGLVASQSGALGHPDSALLKKVQEAPRKNIKLYMDVGIYDLCWDAASLLDDNRKFVRILQEKQYTYYYHEYAGGHNWTCWRDQLPVILEYLFKK